MNRRPLNFGNAILNHNSDPNFCGRAKMVRYGAKLAESGETDLLSAIQIYDGDKSALKLLEGCERCVRPALGGQDFVREQMSSSRARMIVPSSATTR